MSPIAYTAAIIAAAVVLFVWNRLPGRRRRHGDARWRCGRRGVLTLGPGARRLRRSGRHLHRLALRRQRRARDDRRHRLGRPAPDPGRGRGKPDAASAPDDEPRRAADRADQRQRRGRRLAAGRRRHRGPAEAEVLAAPDAARLLGACRLDAGADRHAGERARLGGRPSMPASAASASSSSPSSGVPLLAGTMAIIILFGERLLPERNGATMPADFSRHAKTLVEQYGLASGVYQMRVRGDARPMSARRRPPSISPTFPGLQLVAVQDGEAAAPLRRPRMAEGDHLLLRGRCRSGRRARRADASRVSRGCAHRPAARKPCSTAVPASPRW